MLKTKLNIIPADVVHTKDLNLPPLKQNFFKDIDQRIFDSLHLQKKKVVLHKKKENSYILQEKIAGHFEDMIEMSYVHNETEEYIKLKTVAGYNDLDFASAMCAILEDYLEDFDRNIRDIDFCYTIVQCVKTDGPVYKYTIHKDIKLEGTVEEYDCLGEIFKMNDLD